MKKTFLLSMLACFIMNACTPFKIEESYDSMAQFYQVHSKKAQVFTIDAAKGAMITGAEGTTITFPPMSMMNSLYQPVTGIVDVQLTEFYSLKDMMYANIHTFAEHQADPILITGGSFHLKIIQNGEELRLDPTMVTATMPDKMNIGATSKDQMRAFTGSVSYKDSAKVLNWNWNPLEGPRLNYNTNPPHYDITSLQSGWLNCDAFWNYLVGTERTQFKVKPKSGGKDTQVFMFIKGFPSLVKIYTEDGEYRKTYEKSIPKGIKATILAISVEKELMFGTKEIEVLGDDVFSVKLRKGSTDELSKLIESLN